MECEVALEQSIVEYFLYENLAFYLNAEALTVAA